MEKGGIFFQPRESAINALRELVGQDLTALARWYDVRRQSDAQVRPLNKGWAGHTLERHLDIAANSAQRPDGGDWELKVVPLKRDAGGRLSVKESMAITMLNAADLIATPFPGSHLFKKLRRMVLVGRIYEAASEQRSLISHVAAFDLEAHPELLAQVEADYTRIRGVVRVYGLDVLSGRVGRLVQVRPKGGAGSTARAFYARAGLVQRVLEL